MPSIFETDRLVVRSWTEGDVERVYDIYSRWEVSRWLGSSPKVLESVSEAGEMLQRWAARATPDGRYGVWAVEVRDTAVVAGSILLVPIKRSGEDVARLPDGGGDIEVGWHFHPDFWGHGYATEAAHGAMAKGFAEGLREIVAVVIPDNHRSLAVCRRLGMEGLGRTTKWYDVELEAFRARAE